MVTATVSSPQALGRALDNLQNLRVLIFEEMPLTRRLVTLQLNLCRGTPERVLGIMPKPNDKATRAPAPGKPRRTWSVINLLPIARIESSPFAGQFVVSQLHEEPKDLEHDVRAVWAQYDPSGQADISNWLHACKGFQKFIVGRSPPAQIQLPGLPAADHKSALVVDRSLRWMQLAQIVINAAWLNQGEFTNALSATIIATIGDLRTGLALWGEAGVADHWGAIDERLMNFWQLLREVPWNDKKGMTLPQIHAALQEQFPELASDPAYVACPIPGRNTGEWELRTVRRRMLHVEALLGGVWRQRSKMGDAWYRVDGIDDSYESFQKKAGQEISQMTPV